MVFFFVFLQPPLISCIILQFQFEVYNDVDVDLELVFSVIVV